MTPADPLTAARYSGLTRYARGRARIRARIEKQVHELEVVALGRPVERGEAVALGLMHVCPLFQQRANGLDIFLLHRLNESRVGLLRARRRETGHTQREGDQLHSSPVSRPSW